MRLAGHGYNCSDGPDLCIDVCNFLDGATLSSATMNGGYDAAICALAELFDHSVLGIDNEIGIESGEGMSSHRVGKQDM
jgi:hypothetical protein